MPRATRRIHSKPGSVEIEACFPWLKAEIAAVTPRIILALGATAAQALFGRAFRVTRDRGRLVPSALAPYALATVHPSALLRAPDEQTRDREIRKFVEDLRKVAAVLHMIWRGLRGSTSTWFAVTLAMTMVLVVVVVIAEFWSGLGDLEISPAGWFAMGLGIIVTLALGIA